MNNLRNILEYFNPFSNEFDQASEDFKYQLTKRQQVIAIAAAIAGAIFGLGISSIAAFRFTVERLRPGDNSVADRTSSIFQGTVPVRRKDDAPIINGQIRPEPPSLRIKDARNLAADAMLFAPTEASAIEITIRGEEEKRIQFWYDSDSKSVTIIDADSPETVITAPCKAFEASSQEQLNIILAVSAHLKALRDDFNEGTRNFFPETLKIIRKYFEGENGREYSQRNPLIRDDGIQLWSEQHPETETLALNIQLGDQKLTIYLDKAGAIHAVELDNQKVSPLFLFNKEHIWNSLLSVLLKDFLKENALKVQDVPVAYLINGNRIDFSGTFVYHQAVIKECPELVLSKISPKQMYKYLNDDLTESPAIDAGGLKRQFFSQLALSLFDGAPERDIKVKGGVPYLSNSDSKIDKDILEMAGKNLIRAALIDPEVTLGNILDPSVYSCFNLLIKFDNTLSDDVMVQASQLLCKSSEMDFLFDIYNRSRLFEESEWAQMESIWFYDAEDRPTTPKDAQQFVEEIILDKYRNQVMAIHHMVKGALGYTELERTAIRLVYEQFFDHLPHEEFVEKIQGMKFDPQGIADRIFTDSHDRVVRQKTAWLKEYILESDEEEIKRVLMAITGSTTVTAETKIKISATNAHNCTAATCSTTLYVPTSHTSVGTDAKKRRTGNKDLFLNNFRLIYSEKGFDMG